MYLLNFIKYLGCLTTFMICINIVSINCKLLDITDANYNDHLMYKHEVVFVMFHAEWCAFSQILQPIFEDAANTIANEFGKERVLFGQVDCDRNPTLSLQYKISKYPTLKVFLNGLLMRKEYRGQRTKQAFVNYVKYLLNDSIVHIDYKTDNQLSAINYNTSAIIGYYREYPEQHPRYEIFRRVGADMRGYCDFYWVTGSPHLPPTKAELFAFKSAKSTKQVEYDFRYETHHELSSWSIYLCIPIVRPITFENAEEIVEEGLELVILFHQPHDDESIKLYKKVIEREFLYERSGLNFVTADADMFNHPLVHLNRTKQDLPLIAIDSFKHIYLFPNYSDLDKTGKLMKFIQDLNSGKLHREFHFGPDIDSSEEVVTHKAPQVGEEVNSDENYIQEVDGGIVIDKDQLQEQEGLTDSVFKKLGPSEHRYTLLRRGRDEL